MFLRRTADERLRDRRRSLDPATLDRAERVALAAGAWAWCFQEFRLLDHLTAFENVALPLIVMGQTIDEVRDDVLELMAWVGLSKSVDVYPPVLSGGEKTARALARAIVGKPDLILADEPTRQCRPGARAAPAETVHGAQSPGDHDRHRHA